MLFAMPDAMLATMPMALRWLIRYRADMLRALIHATSAMIRCRARVCAACSCDIALLLRCHAVMPLFAAIAAMPLPFAARRFDD